VIVSQNVVIAYIRFLLLAPDKLLPQIDDALAEEGLNHSSSTTQTKHKQEDNLRNDDSAPKKMKLSGAERRKLSKKRNKVLIKGGVGRKSKTM
jgi:hypothetical protein